MGHVPAQCSDVDIICEECHRPCLCLQRRGSFKNNLGMNTLWKNLLSMLTYW